MRGTDVSSYLFISICTNSVYITFLLDVMLDLARVYKPALLYITGRFFLFSFFIFYSDSFLSARSDHALV
jgi:hypothetical protein